MILAWDPGLRHLGVAGGTRQGGLLFAFMLDNPIGHQVRGSEAHKAMQRALTERLIGFDIDEIAFEKPQTYKGTSYNSGVNQEDLDELVGINYYCQQSFEKVRFRKITSYYPHEWKRNLPKQAMVNRFIGAGNLKPILTPLEQSIIILPKTCIICNKDVSLDVYDAVGIFLHHIGRNFLTG